jgi:hypothetical protein
LKTAERFMTELLEKIASKQLLYTPHFVIWRRSPDSSGRAPAGRTTFTNRRRSGRFGCADR